jgi:predicted adenine nucleotide alpha hydrolase (AANH) superfamily ATPase
LRQQEFTKAYHITKHKELDEKWTAFFYESNVAFNVARHPAFVAVVKATSTAGFDYTPPSYHAMRTKHIKPKVKQVKAEIEKAMKQSIALYGATICSNGWDNIIHRPLMKVMLV